MHFSHEVQRIPIRKNQKGAGAAMGSIRKSTAMKSDHGEEEKTERRVGVDRRQFSYSAYIPERRSGGRRRIEAEPGNICADLEAQDIDE